MTSDGGLPAAIVDGVPCRPYQAGQEGRAISRMLVWRFVVSAVSSLVLWFLFPNGL